MEELLGTMELAFLSRFPRPPTLPAAFPCPMRLTSQHSSEVRICLGCLSRSVCAHLKPFLTYNLTASAAEFFPSLYR